MKNLLAGLAMLALMAPVGAEDVQLQYQGLTVSANLETTGPNWQQGPVVLMTHGTLAHNKMEIMQSLQSAFLDRGISSLAINLSLGLSNREGMYDCATPHRHLHTDALGEIALWQGWLKEQGVTQMLLLGHSRGGNQTARFVQAHDSDLVKGAILVAPQTWTADHAQTDYEKRYKKPLAPLLAKAEERVSANQGDTLMEHVDFIYCEDTSASASAFVSYYRADPMMDTPTVVKAIDKPVLLVAGSNDTVVGNLVPAAKGIDKPNVRLAIVDGADHFFRDLYAEELADVAQAFIEELH